MSAWEPPAPGWTCGECGFEYDAYGPPEIVDAFAGFGRKYQAPLTRGLAGEDLDALVRTRPAPETWSAIEYACHVRDVFRVTAGRVEAILTAGIEPPAVERFDPERAAVERDYAGQDRLVVAGDITTVAEGFGERLGLLSTGDWSRAAVRDGEELTVHWLAVNAVHEGAHHLLDIGRALRHARGR
jgi:hypothetical protein